MLSHAGGKAIHASIFNVDHTLFWRSYKNKQRKSEIHVIAPTYRHVWVFRCLYVCVHTWLQCILHLILSLHTCRRENTENRDDISYDYNEKKNEERQMNPWKNMDTVLLPEAFVYLHTCLYSCYDVAIFFSLNSCSDLYNVTNKCRDAYIS